MTMHPIAGVSRHARLRAIERLGFDPPAAEWRAAVLAITDRTAPLVARDASRGEGGPVDVYLVQLGGRAVQVLWKPEHGVLVTLVAEGKLRIGVVRAPARAACVAANRWRKPRDREPYSRERGRAWEAAE